MALGKCFIKVHYNNTIRSALIGLPLSVCSESISRQGLKTNMNGLILLNTKENISLSKTKDQMWLKHLILWWTEKKNTNYYFFLLLLQSLWHFDSSNKNVEQTDPVMPGKTYISLLLTPSEGNGLTVMSCEMILWTEAVAPVCPVVPGPTGWGQLVQVKFQWVKRSHTMHKTLKDLNIIMTAGVVNIMELSYFRSGRAGRGVMAGNDWHIAGALCLFQEARFFWSMKNWLGFTSPSLFHPVRRS